MTVASLELCKELYEVSGWDNTYMTWRFAEENDTMFPRSVVIDDHLKSGKHITEQDIPAYDLGYLLRKLPNRINKGRKVYRFVLTNSTTDETWIADYLMPFWQKGLPDRGMEVWLHYGDRAKLTEDETPEDAACKLAIELFKQGILKP